MFTMRKARVASSPGRHHTMFLRSRPALVVVLAGALLLGCTAGDEGATPEDTDAEAAETTEPVPTGPAPGVTDDAITVGVQYVDLEAIGDIASLDHGDYTASYEVLFDAINAEGGINGRMIEPIIVGINPVGTEPAEAACTQLTLDEEVFAVIGFFTGDTVLCPLETHATAVFGGEMTGERLSRAQAPWYTAETSSDLEAEIVRAFSDAGEFDDHTVGVYATAAEEAQVNEVILPLLEELGVEVAETAIVDTGEELDLTQSNAQTAVIAERFDAAGVDLVLLPGSTGLGWANGTEPTDYRPQLLLTNPGAVQAFVADPAGRDLSILDDAVAGSAYGPAQNIWELPRMQECIERLEAEGLSVPEPDSLPEDSGSTYIAGTTACINVELFRALVEAAGDDLNYGTLVAGSEGLEVELPSQPEPLTYGPPPSADGDAPAFLFDWDPASESFVLREG